MKSFIVFALFVAAAVALPTTGDSTATIVQQQFNNIGVEGYSYESETSNGIKVEEQAVLKNVGSENEGIAVRGQFSYTAPDGVLYSVTYIADENGFQPQGAHLPVAQ